MAPKDFRRVLKDGDLLTRCLEGERAAREELARACLPRVRKTVMLTAGGGPDTDDLVQTAMARIFTGLHTFRGGKGFLAWLDKVTVNAVRQYYRRRPLASLFPPSEEADYSAAPKSQGPESRLEGQRMIERLATHLATIRPKKRYALVLSAAYGYTSSEAGDLMGCSSETAKKRLQHGRRELLSRMRKDPYLCQVLKEISG